jgi:hypothetical protein
LKTAPRFYSREAGNDIHWAVENRSREANIPQPGAATTR